MSGPYRFTQDSGRSPLDRPHQNLQPAAQPVSYKTNVNRAKTKKWVEAKKNAYDGDDWGDYDEYDEYGTEQDPPPEPAGYGARQAQGQHGAQPSRSFTDPYRQGPQQPARRNSFETGDEHRAFSSMTPVQETPSQQPWAAQAPPPIQTQPAMRQASGAESESSDTPQHRRDFSPSAMPPPLLTKISPAPFGSSTSSPANTQFPPRKSSIGQVDSPVAISPRNRAPSNPATLPFVRPADIYRRVEEERFRERASMDTSRPSLDSLNSPPGPQERPNAASPSAPQAPSLPQAQGISAFDGGFWPGGPQSQQGPGPDSEGFRSVVDQAFTRVDEQRSVPPTPTSKQSDSGVSRSNTDSTSGISPIMSRVPSSATSALRNRNQPGGDGSTPAIAEEASESNTPVSRPTSNNTMLGGAYQVPRKPSPSHSRNISGSSTTDTGLATPTPGESPARSPAFEVREAVPEPETAVLNSTRSTSPDVMEGGLKGKSPAYATREADIASAMRTNPGQYASELSAAEQQSQDAYLDSHNAQSPTDTSLSRSRSESPSKGRVQELAGKFGDVSASRRGSTQSFNSRSSIQSWEKSPGNSRPSSPTKAVPSQLTSSVNDQRPAAGREVSFRPKLPGQWESYATSVPTSSDHDEQDEQLSSHQSYTPDNVRARSPLDEVDLTPTTAKHPVATTGPAPTLTSDPLAALKAAGSAMGEAIQASVGLGSSSSELTHDQAAKHDRGDVYPHKPWQLDRTESSVSTAPPTPPARDTPSSEDMPPPPHLKEKTPEAFPFYNQRQAPVRPTVLPQLSTAPSADDQESDRLRKEIVASLTPQRTSSTPDVDMDRSSLQPIGPSDANRASSILPREYDSYWADGDQTSHDLGRGEGSGPPQASIEHSLPASTSMASEHLEPAKPSIMTRFSWEDNPTPDGHKHAGSSVPVQDAAQEDPNTPSITQSRENETYGGLPAPYFGPNHSVANAGPDNFHDRSIAERSPTPPPASAKPVTSPQTRAIREASPPSGLHVVNSSLNPEAVDMPPRLSAEASLPPQQSDVSPEEATTSHGHTGQQDGEVTPVAETTHGVSFTQGSLPKSPTSDKDKLLGFRDIVTITSSSERIATYNKTRDQWASTDHGLNDWISSAVTSNPELATHPVSQPRPQVAASSLRHRPTGSLSLFGKHSAPSAQQATTGPYYEQYNSAAAQVPTTPTASGAPPPGSNTSSFGGRSTSHQMQTKGKDLLHTAGLLSGKGMTGAKGLFAKGKSRFKGGDKASLSDSVSSSRDTSEEPDFVTSPEGSTEISMDLDSPRDEKKKRRFSSPFHRSSRSRSRPSSIVLPPNIYMDFGNGPTPRSTSPRETPPIGGNRPHTYHAPDAWNTSPDPHWPLGPSTPPRTGLQPPERLGVLPSPAKSAFSLYAQDKDEDVPPVPPIPDGAEDMPRGRQSQDRASHTVLQSVIRYSTPPIMESSRVPNPPIFIDPSAARDVDQKMMGTSQQDTSTQQAVRNSYDEDDTGPGASQDFLPSKTLGRASDVPRSAAPNTFEAGEISPAVSSLGPARSDMSYDGNEKPRSTTESLGQDRPHIRGDISPMILPVAISTSSTRGAPESPVRPGVPHEGQSTYETQVIGAGDVSPMLSPTIGDEEAPPTKKKEVARQTGVGIEDIQAAEVGGVAQTPQYAAAGKNGAAPPPPVATQQRLSASPYHVVHAVQYVPSRSSYESLDWEQDNVAVPSLLDGSQLGVKQQDRDLPPVPQIVQQPAQIQSVVAPNQKPLDDAPVKPSIEEYPPTPSSTSQESEQNAMADTANPGSHKRSQSLLSAISSMVSEDSAPVSPVSSQTRKSRPSSRGRQRQASLPKPTPSSVAIVEELDPVQPQGMATADDPDLDLYADHNGIVKGVQDERGQPLRVAAFQDSGVSQASYPSTSRAAKAVDLSDPEEDTRRNSVERPMSFISGPTDDNGMPQDEINRPGPTGAGPQIPSTPQTPSKLQGQYQRRPRRNHTETHQSQVNNQPNEQDQVLRSPEKKPGYSNVYSPQNSRRPQQAQVPPHSDVSPPPSSNVSPPPQPSAPPGLAQRRLLQDSNPQSGTDQVSGMQDPRLQVQNPNAQLASHTADPRTFGVISGGLSSQDPRLRMPMQTQTHGPDPRIQAHQMPQPPAPRTHVEQMMQRPVVNPPLQNGGYRMPGIESPELNTHSAKEKSSSRPKLSSVFKSLGGRSSSSTQQTSNQKNDRINPDPAATGVLNRSAQPQLPAPVLPAEQAVAKKKERKSGTFGSMPSRSQSVETESHVSHASLDSTRVQATDSRLDLRYPTNPVPFRGIPPQQPPPGTPPPPPPKQQTQRASTSGIPEAGKKKRFSSLGALFGRSGTTGHAVPAKSKSSRDDKKSQKIQKHNLSIQPPPAQQWNPQQQRPIPPYNSQYGPPLATARSGPGMQSMAPPQGGPPRDTPRYYQSPQGYQQQQQTYPQQGRPDTSAYAGTRQIAQAHQFQQQGVQAPPASVSNARPPMPDPQFSFEPITPPTDSVQNPPPAGYYPPDRKPPVHDNTTPVSMPAQRVALQQQPQNQGYPQPPSQPHPQPQPLPQQQNAAPQHQANMRRVSSPTSSRGPTPMSAVSQVHRRVSSPMAEPQYETPQIPAAYNPVSGPYVAGEHQPPQPHLQNARPPPAPYGTTPDRQYSDSRMQPLSPQVSAQSQMIPNQRTHSDASSVSLVSPVANQNPASATRAGSPASNPRLPRMTSISEATHPERPWNLNLPEGATEQEIVRARQKHYLEQQLATQEQLHAERTGQSPSPRPSPNTQSPSPNSPLNQAVHESRPSQQQGAGGFREVLPRGAPQLYDLGHDQHEPTISHVHSPHPLQPAPIHPEQVGPPASYALPMSPASMNTRSPVNHLTDALPPPPPPKIPHSPMRPDFAGSQSPLHHTPQHIDHQPQHFEPPPPEQEPDYEQQPPDEPPPSYSGPGLPNDGMDKERPRLPSIMTDAEIRGSHDPDPRRRQLSVTMLQHPQPASMAASPQRSSADMGADILRRQMFEQADRDRKEREQRADAERAQSERERQERDLNRARARELERSYSGGGSVGSLRSQNGSGRGTGRGRGARGGARPIFELPAVEDDEPVMRATSFPGQEWVPRWDED